MVERALESGPTAVGRVKHTFPACSRTGRVNFELTSTHIAGPDSLDGQPGLWVKNTDYSIFLLQSCVGKFLPADSALKDGFDQRLGIDQLTSNPLV